MTGVAAVVGLALANAFDFQRMRAQAALLRTALEQDRPMIGESTAMKKIYDIIARVATAETTVLLLREGNRTRSLLSAALIATAAALGRASRSTAPLWATIFWKASCSAMKKGRLPAPWV